MFWVCDRHIWACRYLSSVILHSAFQGGGILSNDFVYGVAVAADNSVFLLGSQDDFDTTGTDFAASKIDSDGDLLWEWKVRLVFETFHQEAYLRMIFTA